MVCCERFPLYLDTKLRTHSATIPGQIPSQATVVTINSRTSLEPPISLSVEKTNETTEGIYLVTFWFVSLLFSCVCWETKEKQID